MTRRTCDRTEETRLLCKEVYDLSADGFGTINQIADEVGVKWDTVQRWLSQPAKYDPYIDEVAVRRAIDGDGAVYAALTIWERDEFFLRIQEIKEKFFGYEWDLYVQGLARNLGVNSRTIQRGLRFRRTGA